MVGVDPQRRRVMDRGVEARIASFAPAPDGESAEVTFVGGSCFAVERIIESGAGSTSASAVSYAERKYFDAEVRWLTEVEEACEDDKPIVAAAAALEPLVEKWLECVKKAGRERSAGQLDGVLADLGEMPEAKFASKRALGVRADQPAAGAGSRAGGAAGLPGRRLGARAAAGGAPRHRGQHLPAGARHRGEWAAVCRPAHLKFSTPARGSPRTRRPARVPRLSAAAAAAAAAAAPGVLVKEATLVAVPARASKPERAHAARGPCASSAARLGAASSCSAENSWPRPTATPSARTRKIAFS